MTKFAFEFDDVRSNFECFLQIQNSSNVFQVPLSNSNFRSTRLEPHVYTYRTLEQVNNKCALPNSLKGPKIILNMADNINRVVLIGF